MFRNFKFLNFCLFWFFDLIFSKTFVYLSFFERFLFFNGLCYPKIMISFENFDLIQKICFCSTILIFFECFNYYKKFDFFNILFFWRYRFLDNLNFFEKLLLKNILLKNFVFSSPKLWFFENFDCSHVLIFSSKILSF